MWKRAEVFFFDWIRFGDLSLQLLLERVEDYCKDKDLERWNKDWVEGGRRFKLERHSNEVGKFLLCSVVVEEEKRFSLVFRERRVSWGMADSSREAVLFRCSPFNRG